MADMFDVRMKFTDHLKHLNASVNSSKKAAHYAIKYKEFDEDLHSCILEQLEMGSVNNRANIMYFIEQLCDMAQRENQLEYVRMVQRDIMRIIDAVAPNDGSGAANVKVVRKVLAGLQQKTVLQSDTVTELEDCLKERDTGPAYPAMSPTATGDTPNKPASPSGGRSNGAVRQDKRQIEQRIEEDRERHKRLRESYWAVSPEDHREFEALWDDTSDIGEDDFIAAHEDAAERRRAILDVVQRA